MSGFITNIICIDVLIPLFKTPHTVDNMQVACFVTSHGQYRGASSTTEKASIHSLLLFEEVTHLSKGI